MKRRVMHFPGDPPMEVLEMTRAEFLQRHPRSPMSITNLDSGERTEFPVDADEVICDFCNDDPGEVVVTYADLRGYCLKCAAENWFPHCGEPKEVK